MASAVLPRSARMERSTAVHLTGDFMPWRRMAAIDGRSLRVGIFFLVQRFHRREQFTLGPAITMFMRLIPTGARAGFSRRKAASFLHRRSAQTARFTLVHTTIIFTR